VASDSDSDADSDRSQSRDLWLDLLLSNNALIVALWDAAVDVGTFWAKRWIRSYLWNLWKPKSTKSEG
jgi:hypothetical protein